MKFNVRRNSIYYDVSFEHDSTKIDFGLMNEDERNAFVEELVSTANDICTKDKEVIIRDLP